MHLFIDHTKLREERNNVVLKRIAEWLVKKGIYS